MSLEKNVKFIQILPFSNRFDLHLFTSRQHNRNVDIQLQIDAPKQYYKGLVSPKYEFVDWHISCSDSLLSRPTSVCQICQLFKLSRHT